MAGLITRAFSGNDTAQIWVLLNEVKAWIDTLNSQGAQAKFYTGQPADDERSFTDGRYTSFKASRMIEQAGDLTPKFDGDAFSLPAGKYRIDVQVAFDANSTGYRTLLLFKNIGTATYGATGFPPGTRLREAKGEAVSGNTSVAMSKVLTVAATDKLILVARQNSGGSLKMLGYRSDSELTIQRIGD